MACLPNQLRACPGARRNRPPPPITHSRRKRLQKSHPCRHRHCTTDDAGSAAGGSTLSPRLRSEGSSLALEAVLTGRPRTELGRDTDLPPGSLKASAHSTKRELSEVWLAARTPRGDGQYSPTAEEPAAGAPGPAGSGGPPHSPLARALQRWVSVA